MKYLTLLSSLLLSSSLLAQPTTNPLKLDRKISWQFMEYYPCEACCEDDYIFKKQNRNTFIYYAPTDLYGIAQKIQLEPIEKMDSIIMHAQYDNTYGFFISETEGAYIYDGKEKEAYYTSPWRKINQANEDFIFDLSFFGLNGGFITDSPPLITLDKIHEWKKENGFAQYLFDEYQSAQVFCSQMRIRINMHYKKKKKTYYVVFNRMVGGC